MHIALHEIRRVRLERDVAAIGTDRGCVAGRVGLHAVGAQAHALDVPGVSIMDEDVAHSVRVVVHEIGRVRRERHVPTVLADRRRVACRVGLGSVRRDAHALDGAAGERLDPVLHGHFRDGVSAGRQTGAGRLWGDGEKLVPTIHEPGDLQRRVRTAVGRVQAHTVMGRVLSHGHLAGQARLLVDLRL